SSVCLVLVTATLVPYTTLFRSNGEAGSVFRGAVGDHYRRVSFSGGRFGIAILVRDDGPCTQRKIRLFRFLRDDTTDPIARSAAADRKSTRLNSSHVKISYADFC